ncbi:MAG: adenosyl-hopene transferase HpnH [Candidatus Anammoxibacter sp.]
MRFPISLIASMTKHLIRNKLLAKERFPLVLMLEVTHLCNLNCEGCGRIREYKESLNNMMTVDDCFAAAAECDTPVVTVTGGEPLLHPDIDKIIAGLIERKKHLYMCTNGIILEQSLEKFKPKVNLNINVHLDGLSETHDAIVGQKGVFDIATNAIKAAKQKGFRVCTNTTVYKNTAIDEIKELFGFLESLGVDGMLVSPGFSFEDNDNDVFMNKEEIHEKFMPIFELSKQFKIISSPLYLRFLKGERHLLCTPWGNPTRNFHGWKSPCYLLTDKHCKTFKELMGTTDWDKFRFRKDDRCKNCMIHCGVEPTVVLESGKRLSDTIEMALWNLR